MGVIGILVVRIVTNSVKELCISTKPAYAPPCAEDCAPLHPRLPITHPYGIHDPTYTVCHEPRRGGEIVARDAGASFAP